MAEMWEQHADARMDWGFDFSEPLGEDTINGTPVVTASAGLTCDLLDYDERLVRVRLSGGEAGEYYTVTCLVETASGNRLAAAQIMYIWEAVAP